MWKVLKNSPENNHKPKPQKITSKDFDVIVIGAGPAGLTAALYTARAGFSTLVLERENIGGQMTQSPDIRNYPGFEEISGKELADVMKRQAENAGVTFDEFSLITSVDLRRRVLTDGNKYLRAMKAFIIATGTKQTPLDVPGAKELTGRGVHYCALCDGHLYKGKKVAVVGGGSSALTEALYLSRIAESVTIIRRKDYFKADQMLLDEVNKTDNITILYNTDIVSLSDEKSLHHINIRTSGKAPDMLPCDGIFVYIGSTPNTELFSRYIRSDGINADLAGFIETNEQMETAIPGVYAVGDVRSKTVRQIAAAVGDGATAGSSIGNHHEL
jgi:thioredoxin reductase (NADPH)